MNFLEKLKAAFNVAYTENGAVSHASTQSAVLDLYALGGAARNLSVQQLKQMVIRALNENPTLATKVIFYLGDIRQGQGERRFFKLALNEVLKYFDNSYDILKQVPEFNRWDVVIELFNTNPAARKIVLEKFKAGDDALFFKWLPSHRAHGKTNPLAVAIQKALGIREEVYRKYVKNNRQGLNLVETNLTNKDYPKIDYNKVPSVAGVKYRKAFYRVDNARYTAHVNEATRQAKAVAAGTMKATDVTVKVNAGVLYPHQIISKYIDRGGIRPLIDPALEAQWYSLPDYLNNDNSAGVLPIIDTSGSMFSYIGDSKVRAIDVALGFGMYFSERLKGEFKDYFLNFSDKSKLVHPTGKSLWQKLCTIEMNDWGGSTNIQAAFDKILSIAIANNMKQENLPATLLVISDMQFNDAGINTNFDTARKKFAAHGYKLPDVVFWNVNVRYVEVPATMHNSGVVLVSGYSPITIKFITSGEIVTPYDLMLKTINTPRYSFIDKLNPILI